MQDALILFAHGARDPEWALPLQRVRQLVAARKPGLVVELAYLEFMLPTLDECFAGLAEKGICRVTVQPMFIAQGGHLKRELPEMLARQRQRHPQMEITLARAIGEDDSVLAAMADAAIAAAASESGKQA